MRVRRMLFPTRGEASDCWRSEALHRPRTLRRCPASHASHDRLLRAAAETALAGTIDGDRLLEQLAAEVRPEGVEEHELRVGALPEQEVGDALLAAGAHEQIGIG